MLTPAFVLLVWCGIEGRSSHHPACGCGAWCDEEAAVHYERGTDMTWVGDRLELTKDVWVAHRRPKDAVWRKCR